MFIATLIAKERLTRGDISAAQDAVGDTRGFAWIDEGRAGDLELGGDPGAARRVLEGLLEGVDVIVQPAAGRRKRLIVADMDSTMIGQECIDELADYAGLKAEIAAVTERAMRGELEFETALEARVALLKGMDAAVIDRCRAERVRLTPGARALVRTMKTNGAHALLVSGGFTRFAGPVAEEVGFDRAIANVLEIADGRLAGTVARPIVGAAAKRDALVEAAARLGLAGEETLAVGDGANDIPMIEAAGLGVAYRAKPPAAAAADARIEANDLTALLYAQGYPRKEWVAD